MEELRIALKDWQNWQQTLAETRYREERARLRVVSLMLEQFGPVFASAFGTLAGSSAPSAPAAPEVRAGVAVSRGKRVR